MIKVTPSNTTILQSQKFNWIELSLDSNSLKRNYEFKTLSNFGFIESCTYNINFDILRNDHKHNIYLPVKDKKGKLSIHSIDISNNNITSDTFVMNVCLLDGFDSLTCFGFDLSDNGILWLCIFNCNKILGINLIKKIIDIQFDNIPCPNGICKSLIDTNILYVCGGKSIRNPWRINNNMNKNTILAVTPTIGVIYILNIKNKSFKIMKNKDLDTQAGIIEIKGKLFSSQLYNIIRIDNYHNNNNLAINTTNNNLGISTTNNKHAKNNNHNELNEIWNGTNIDNGEYCYLSDNLTAWDNHRFISSIYRKIPIKSLIGIKNKDIATIGWSIGKLMTSITKCITCNDENDLNNAELLDIFSNQDTFDDICFMIYDVFTKQPIHFKIKHSILNIPNHIHFDGHVTHICHYYDKVIFINFQSNHILIMNDQQIKLKLVQKTFEYKASLVNKV